MQRENSIIFRFFSQRSNIEKEALRPAALSNVRAQQKKTRWRNGILHTFTPPHIGTPLSIGPFVSLCVLPRAQKLCRLGLTWTLSACPCPGFKGSDEYVFCTALQSQSYSNNSWFVRFELNACIFHLSWISLSEFPCLRDQTESSNSSSSRGIPTDGNTFPFSKGFSLPWCYSR